MIVFTCTCGDTWVIDLEASKIIEPIRVDETFDSLNTSSNEKTSRLYIGNKRKEISLGYFRDSYSDCWHDLCKRIEDKT